jgi:23S rRNA (uracil1939-C5)-methyltransferase
MGVELRIDSLAAGGDGVGRLPDGRIAFVPYSAPGDRVRVRVVESRARFARARVEALLEAGPARVDPVCPAFGSCGGCAWQHVDYAAQLEAKRAILVEALRRIGGLEAEVAPVLPSPAAYGYRGRTRIRVERGRVGYLRRHSHSLCAVSCCPVLVPALEGRLRALAADPPAEEGEWELSIGSGGVRAAPLASRGAPATLLEVGGQTIRVSHGVFAQSNALLLGELAARVVEAAGRGALAVELFAGAGLFTLGLARRFERVVAVEGDPAAVGDLRANLAQAGAGGVEIAAEPVERALPRFARLRPQALVLDPPRTGLRRRARRPRGGARRLPLLRSGHARARPRRALLARPRAALGAGDRPLSADAPRGGARPARTRGPGAIGAALRPSPGSRLLG